MADIKIDGLDAAAALTDADLFEIFQPGEAAGTRSRKLTLATLRAKIGLQTIPIAIGDESSAVSAGTNKIRFRLPHAFRLTGVFASVGTAPTGAALVIDINAAGTTLLSTKLSIDATHTHSGTSAAPAVISDADVAAFEEWTVDFDQVGSTVAGAGVKVILVGYIP